MRRDPQDDGDWLARLRVHNFQHANPVVIGRSARTPVDADDIGVGQSPSGSGGTTA